MRASGGRDPPPMWPFSLGERFFKKVQPSDSECPIPAFKMSGMKTKSIRYHRNHLLPVPYSPRPDHLERGLRMLRALRLKLQSAPTRSYARQVEFDFAQRRHA